MPTVNELLQSLEQANESISITQLLEMHPDFTRRTTQRWLSQLIEDNKIIVEGSGRSRVYRVVPTTETSQNLDQYPSYIPLSADSRDILNYIDQPLEARKPVGYDISFLEEYQPNKTFYLSEPLRRQLYKMGDTQ